MTELEEKLLESIKANSQRTMFTVFGTFLEAYRKLYKNPIEMLEADLKMSFAIWNPAGDHCSECGSAFPPTGDFSPVGYADFRGKEFCSSVCAESWFAAYGKTLRPQTL